MMHFTKALQCQLWLQPWPVFLSGEFKARASWYACCHLSCTRSAVLCRTEEEEDDDYDDEDDDLDDDEANNHDNGGSRTRIQVDGWLTLETESSAVAPLLCLRHRLSACFAAKVGACHYEPVTVSLAMCSTVPPGEASAVLRLHP